MKQLSAWIQRLNEAEPANLAEHFFRVMIPGSEPLNIEDCFIATSKVGQLAIRPGDCTPISASVLRFLDTNTPKRSIEVHQQLMSEMAALLTLASERRVEVAHELAMKIKNQDRILFSGYGDIIDRTLIGPVQDQFKEAFLHWLSKVLSLPEPHLSVIGAACNLHHGAVLLFEKDLRSAYLLLIAAIEVLSRQYGAPPTEWADWEESGQWEKFIIQIDLSQSQQEALKEKLMSDKHLRLKATFRNYGVSRLRDSFWDEPWKEWMYSINANRGRWGSISVIEDKKVRDVFPQDRTVLSKLLGSSYDTRSGLVHRGERLGLLKSVLPFGTAYTNDGPLPFALLRAILVELIKVEIAEYGSETTLPDFKLIAE